MTNLNTNLFLKFPKSFLTLFGLWAPTGESTLLMTYMIFIMATQYSFLLFETIYIANVWGDFGEVSDSSYLLFTQASVCLKATILIKNKINLKILMDLMDSEVFEQQSENHVRILKKCVRYTKNLCMIFVCSATTTVTLWSTIPLLNISSRMLPYKIWMPGNPDNYVIFISGYIYQTMAIYISSLIFMGVDSVALFMIMFGSAQLEIVMDKLEKVKPVPVHNLQKHELKDIREHNIMLLNECVKQHEAIIKFIKIVEDTYHFSIFFQLAGTALIVCNIALRLTIEDPRSMKFFSMFFYMITMLSQLLLYCWIGNEITIRSEKLRDKMYILCPWYEQNVKYRRAMWIAMECMKKPIIFKAGHYISLSRPTFVTILRCSYSYFAVLNSSKGE